MIGLRNKRDLRKRIDNGNNSKELLHVPWLGNTHTTRIAEMGRAGQWVKVLQETDNTYTARIAEMGRADQWVKVLQ